MDTSISIKDEVKACLSNGKEKILKILFPRVSNFLEVYQEISAEIERKEAEHLVTNTIDYLNELWSGDLTQDNLDYISNLFNNPESEHDEGLRIMAILNNAIDDGKCHYLAQITIACAKRIITYNQYLDYSELLNNIQYYDLIILLGYWDKLDENGAIVASANLTSFRRLTHYGIGEQSFDPIKEYDVDNINKALFVYDEYAQKFINIINGNLTQKSKISDKIFLTTRNTAPIKGDSLIYYDVVDDQKE